MRGLRKKKHANRRAISANAEHSSGGAESLRHWARKKLPRFAQKKHQAKAAQLRFTQAAEKELQIQQENKRISSSFFASVDLARLVTPGGQKNSENDVIVAQSPIENTKTLHMSTRTKSLG